MNANHIAFYAPLKSADHEVPSGDRLMARSLIRCIRMAGYQVETVSHLRARISDPHDQSANEQLLANAEKEIERISTAWKKDSPPACWFCYHPYYKSPDLIGLELCKNFDVPYVTAEASYSERRTNGFWGFSQSKVLDAINEASVNLYFTERDKSGLREGTLTANLAKLAPFIKPIDAVQDKPAKEPLRLLTVAMMREGDKFNSYAQLAEALALIKQYPWVLHIVGDGEMRSEVRELFQHFPPDKVVWHGEQTAEEVTRHYLNGYLYVWPGCGEAYGLAYLEAQSAGLPVVAYKTAGVPEVVEHQNGGLLVNDKNPSALANAIEYLLSNPAEHQRMSKSARSHVLTNHSFDAASELLNSILQRVIGKKI